MIPEKFEEWKITVLNLNKMADEIIESRNKVYKVISDELKDAFKNYNPHVFVAGDGSIARVTFKKDEKVKITPDMGLNYPFLIYYELDEYANWITVLEFQLLDE